MMTANSVIQKNVIIIEDEPAIADLVTHILDAPQLHLTRCHTGNEGLAKVVDLKPDLVVLDLMLPGVSGKDIYAYIRADDELKHTPILILSVSNPQEFERLESYRRSEIDAFISKPFDMTAFRRVVQELLGTQLW
jgi:two-component system, OmpR family, alkaline phosphatase synthesis response regulator PhoP